MAGMIESDATEALKQLTYLASAMKAPRITESAVRLANHARDAAGFPAPKTIEEFDRDALPAVGQQIAALASGGFLAESRNVVLLGPPGTGKTHLATGLGIAAAHHGHRALSATATA